MTTYLDKHEACKLLKICDRTLARYRDTEWHLGIHYFKPVQKILYNRELIEDWLVNRRDYPAHLRAMEAYQASLLSNQPRKRR
jgi:hypothetical protein